MSIYQFAPPPPLGSGSNPFATWENGFTDAELDLICETGEMVGLDKATVYGTPKEKDISAIRETQTAWIKRDSSTEWIYDKIAWVARQLNAEFFRYDLFGFVEDFQYTVYTGERKSHYNWHVDHGFSDISPRKLSISLQLSDENDYEGGDLLIRNQAKPTKVTRQKGTVIAFPSYMLHKVTPVTKGTRKSLVVWIAGPAFK